MVNVVANSTVTKIKIIMDNSYGAGNYAMCGKAYDPRFIFAWPSAKIAVMRGAQAAEVLHQIQKSKGEENEEDTERLLEEIKKRSDQQTTPYYAAARLRVDEIIDPTRTSEYIDSSLRVAQT